MCTLFMWMITCTTLHFMNTAHCCTHAAREYYIDTYTFKYYLRWHCTCNNLVALSASRSCILLLHLVLCLALNIASRSLPSSNLSFHVTLISPISCILPPCRNPAARNNFFSYRLIYLRTIHYSSRSLFILLLFSLLALAFCSYISLPCCNHATRNNFYSYRLIYLRTIHSVVYLFAANYSKRIRRNL